MRRLFALALASVFVCALAAPALAGNRQIAYPNQNPTAEQFNGQARFQRLALGSWIRDALGSNLTAGGVYDDLTVSPNGGMYVAVAPTTTNTLGTLYQLAVDDPNPMPNGAWSPQLSADVTTIVVQGQQSGPSGSIGPISAPSPGLSQYYLVEAQILTTDTTPINMTFLNSQGTPSTLSENSVRQDEIVYQLKAGTASASPTEPSVDSGWIGISYILVPGGTSTITSGMILALPSFPGFVANGSNVTLGGITITGAAVGCLQVTTLNAPIQSEPCTSGLGTVNATSPITAVTSSGVATVACPTCVSGVSATSPVTANISSNLLTVGLSHGDYVDLTSAQTVGGAKTFSSGLISTITTGQVLKDNSATTSFLYQNYANTSGTALLGIEGSTGGNLFVGDSAYSTVFGTQVAESLQFATNNTVRMTIGPVGSILATGTLTASAIISAAGATANNFTWTCGSGAGVCDIGENGSAVVAGIAANVLDVNNGTNTTAGSYVALDTSGDVGAGGEFYSGAGYGSCSYRWGASGGNACLGAASSVSVAGIVASLALFQSSGSGNVVAVDASGDIGAAGVIEAGSSFYARNAYGGSGYDYFLMSGASSGWTTFGAGSGWSVAGVTCSELGIVNYAVSVQACMDTSGDLGITGNFYASSSRALKRDIGPLPFDPLAIIDGTKWVQWCYKANEECKSERPGDATYGYVAEDTSAYLSGPAHNRTSAQNLAAVDAAAIKELAAKSNLRIDALQKQILSLYALVAILFCFVIALILKVRRRG